MQWIAKNRSVLAAALVFVLAAGWAFQRTKQLAVVESMACGPFQGLRPGLAAAPSGDEAMAWYQGRIKQCATDHQAYAQLGAIYLQRARDTGDPSYYSKAEQVVGEALKLQPDDQSALTLQASLALGRHQFAEARQLGERVVALNPQRAQGYGVLGDAQVELGQYDAAVGTIQKMVDLRPDLSSYARVSYLRELHGDLPGAIEAMRTAAESGSPAAENTAWTRVQLGHLYFNTGQLADAEREYSYALALMPGYVHAEAGLARVAAGRGDYERSRSLYDGVVKRMPLVEYVIALGEVELAAGQQQAARKQFDLALTLDELYRQNGVVTDLEMALFLADHGDPAAALVQARQAYQARPGVKAADVLAWALSQSGQHDEAQQMMGEALKLGTQDPLLFYHAGMIAYRRGDHATAGDWLRKALALNPFFSPLAADAARATLAELRN